MTTLGKRKAADTNHSDRPLKRLKPDLNSFLDEESDSECEKEGSVDEFEELSNEKGVINTLEGFASDDEDVGDDDETDLQQQQEQRKKQIQDDVEQDAYEEKRANDAALKADFSFVFPSYKKLSRERKEIAKLGELKIRIESVLQVLCNFKLLRDEHHSRKEYMSLLSHSMSRYYGYNLDLMNMFVALFHPNECVAFVEANESSRPVTLRSNTMKCRRRDLAKLLINRGLNLDPLGKWSKSGLVVQQQQQQESVVIPLGATPEYLSGYYMIQSAASLLPTLALDIKGQQHVLDMCCAPGGKTSHIAQLLRNTGVVLANDINQERLKAVYANIHRMGLSNVVIVNMDARQLSQHFDPVFDRVLLDAPCSCLGVISRDPSIKSSKTFNDVVKMSALQKELILTAIDCCKVNGYVVYSTCSVSPYENEAVVQHALDKRFVKVVETGLPFGEKGFARFKHLKFNSTLSLTKRFYPHVHNMDGFYVAKLYKCDKGSRTSTY